MKQILFLLAMIVSFQIQAKTIFCDIKINMISQADGTVVLIDGDRKIVAQTGEVRVYVSQKQNQIIQIEGFLPAEEARFYAEGKLDKDTDTLSASFWNRDHIIDIICQSPVF